MNIKKLFRDYIIVEKKVETKTASGLIIPLAAQEKQLIGIVKYVGKDIDDEDIKPGVEILFDRLNSSPSPTGDESEVMIQYDDIIALT